MTLLDLRTQATMIGGIAIVFWALLALFTTEVGAIPPFQLVSLCFSVAAIFSFIWIARGSFSAFRALRQPIGA